MTLPDLSAEIGGIFLGRVQDRWDGKPPSAIQKDQTLGRQAITLTGFSDDAQADLTVHGGEDKAIHHYASDHYAAWQNEGQMAAGTKPAAFGENIATTELTEENLCIGDILKLGTATVQISQGRQPCWKLGLYTGNEKMPYLFQKTGRTGWYYRVLETGTAEAGDRITLIERRNPDWSVLHVTRARLTRRVSPEEAQALAELTDLAIGWRQAFARMAGGDTEEDTSARLAGQQ
ncbi:MOSC domain-containing protein [Tropicibacter sp. R16_0]|uniref:MOSC domain-containing protein n=1 Tax=Tropicibacter sp. R16_0 TaxID=2821102 RepID=UPI001AD9B972|nr:MOSC domain-containing protein [Tropicibacter sp. R16_0]MBO9449863.1 MOSC domain-containing protein [Tropicibacter sp. R16_0]